ncbi:unnamed protein product [Owenia fusiformis]|uniref:Uncharacterized protein n=1 Tax=Owenia fusiformis TaxID=6347 RepID=A0A8J1TAT8_OWEFU|nr:unnamed protein product [Owenia fusiformis]
MNSKIDAKRSHLQRLQSLQSKSSNSTGCSTETKDTSAHQIVAQTEKKFNQLPFVNLPTIKILDHYPDGGWGWVIVFAVCTVNLLCQGLHLGFGVIGHIAQLEFGISDLEAAWLASLSYSFHFLIQPLVIAICQRKSTRLYAVIGGLILSLGFLFLGFSTKLHEIFISSTVIALGTSVAMTTGNTMVGRYFKVRRNFAEIFVTSSGGLGIAVVPSLVTKLFSFAGWLRSFQVATGAACLVILAGAFYRSVSLYHPRRRLILHLKRQKAKRPRKERQAEKPPYFDAKCLHLKSLQILLFAVMIISWGVFIPFFYLPRSTSILTSDDERIAVLCTIGVSFVTGCMTSGCLLTKGGMSHHIGRQYICALSVFVCAVSIAFLSLVSCFHGCVVIACVYGIFCGSYAYTLKVYTYEVVRFILMERAWGFVQLAQAIPVLLGLPTTEYLNQWHSNTGFFFATFLMCIGTVLIMLVPIGHRQASTQTFLRDIYAHDDELNDQLDMNAIDLIASPDISTRPFNNFTVYNTGAVVRDTKLLQQVVNEHFEMAVESSPISTRAKVAEFLIKSPLGMYLNSQVFTDTSLSEEDGGPAPREIIDGVEIDAETGF